MCAFFFFFFFHFALTRARPLNGFPFSNTTVQENCVILLGSIQSGKHVVRYCDKL